MSIHLVKLYFIIPLLLQKSIWIPTRLILIFFGRLEVRGLKNLKGINANVIFASNHPSELDPFLIPASLPFRSHFSPLFYATREKPFYDSCGWRRHLFGEQFIKMWGGYKVLVGLRDYEKSLPHHIRIVRDGGSLCVFPEGGKATHGNFQPAKGGVVYLAERSNCPIVPVGFSGLCKMTVSDFFFRRQKITVHFGKIIYPKELNVEVAESAAVDGKIYKAKAEYVMERVKQLVPAAQRLSPVKIL